MPEYEITVGHSQTAGAKTFKRFREHTTNTDGSVERLLNTGRMGLLVAFDEREQINHFQPMEDMEETMRIYASNELVINAIAEAIDRQRSLTHDEILDRIEQ